MSRSTRLALLSFLFACNPAPPVGDATAGELSCEDNCECDSDMSCAYGCFGASCAPSCNSNDLCEVDCNGVGLCDVACNSVETCRVACSDAAECRVNCNSVEACEVECPLPGQCAITCNSSNCTCVGPGCP
ncbi:MAG: hypothetical protein IPK80_08150 [Nannocystis sp.]|nr:hypothetical protein [Nannocystis sp.]